MHLLISINIFLGNKPKGANKEVDQTPSENSVISSMLGGEFKK